MTQEEKQLLLVDLCARLPYHLLGKDVFGKTREMKVIYPTGTIIAQEIDGENCSSCGFIPYLRPMSSMTEEEVKEFAYRILQQPDLDAIHNWQTLSIDLNELSKVLDWLNKKHFDYRGLIPRGLALGAFEDDEEEQQ